MSVVRFKSLLDVSLIKKLRNVFIGVFATIFYFFLASHAYQNQIPILGIENILYALRVDFFYSATLTGMLSQLLVMKYWFLLTRQSSRPNKIHVFFPWEYFNEKNLNEIGIARRAKVVTAQLIFASVLIGANVMCRF
jgi:hypothetical protein